MVSKCGVSVDLDRDILSTLYRSSKINKGLCRYRFVAISGCNELSICLTY